jgi:prepilin-type N-terminal cleavage/methylation domain-containing protein
MGVREKMKSKLRISQHKIDSDRALPASRQRGFTLIEILVAVAIIGMVSLVLYPSIINSLETRSLENASRDILNTLQRAKFEAVKTRINHRVRFELSHDIWMYFIEREDNPGSWNSMPGFNRRFIPTKFTATVNFPNQIVQFSPLGFVSNYDSTQNSISIQSPKLGHYNQPDQRVVSVYIGGSVQFTKVQGGE